MNQQVSDRLRKTIPAVAKHKRIGMYELANDSGLHYDTIRKFINGTSDMTLTRVEQIADALGFTVVGLIQWKHK